MKRSFTSIYGHFFITLFFLAFQQSLFLFSLLVSRALFVFLPEFHYFFIIFLSTLAVDIWPQLSIWSIQSITAQTHEISITGGLVFLHFILQFIQSRNVSRNILISGVFSILIVIRHVWFCSNPVFRIFLIWIGVYYVLYKLFAFFNKLFLVSAVDKTLSLIFYVVITLFIDIFTTY